MECCGDNESVDFKTELDSTFISYHHFGEQQNLGQQTSPGDLSMDIDTIQDHFDMMDNSQLYASRIEASQFMRGPRRRMRFNTDHNLESEWNNSGIYLPDRQIQCSLMDDIAESNFTKDSPVKRLTERDES